MVKIVTVMFIMLDNAEIIFTCYFLDTVRICLNFCKMNEEFTHNFKVLLEHGSKYIFNRNTEFPGSIKGLEVDVNNNKITFFLMRAMKMNRLVCKYG